MASKIHSIGMPSIICKTQKELKIHEAFFRGMEIPYALEFPKKTIMHVQFQTSIMAENTDLDQKISRVQKQMGFLATAKNISDEDRTTLRQYYENTLQQLTTKREQLLEFTNKSGTKNLVHSQTS